MITFQELIVRLQQYWSCHGCVLLQPFDMEVGAGSFHPATFLRSLGPEYWRCSYVQPSRRPTDGRYGENPNRLQHYYQYQVMLKPSPDDIVDLYMQSLGELGIDARKHDIRLVEDNWESPTLGAWGLGWEVWLNGMEVSQFTYFQQTGGFACFPTTGELTYGLERLAMFLQKKTSIYDITWSDSPEVTYGDVFLQNECEQSRYNFELADIEKLQELFSYAKEECERLCAMNVPLAAYEQSVKASHIFNLLDARGAISVTLRQRYILQVRELTKKVAQCYIAQRKELRFPLAPKWLREQSLKNA